MFIYLTTNNKDGKRYVGQSSFLVEDKPNYIGSGSKFTRAVECHGKENFTRVILERDIIDLDVLNEREVYWIAYYKTYDNARDYNLTKGGEGTNGHAHSVETKAKITAANKKRWEDPEQRAKRSAGLKNYFKDPEYRARHSAKMKVINTCPEYRAKMSVAKKGTTTIHNPDTKKIRQVREPILSELLNTGWILGRCPEYIAKMSAAIKGRKYVYNPDTKKTRVVKEPLLSELLNSGWILGRK